MLLLILACSPGLTPAREKYGDPETGDPADDSVATDDSALVDDSAAPVEPYVQPWPEDRIGIFYLTWHAYAAKAMAALPADARDTVDAVITEDGASFADLLYNDGLYNTAMAFHYHQEPAPGFYCLYRERDGEAPYDEPYAGPDCGDIASVAQLHAAQLTDAGVDFVYVDLTNLPTYTAFGDVLGLRPLEVLLDEWSALRARGVATPQVAAWVPLSAVGADETPMVRKVLAVYADYADSDLLFRQHEGDAPALFGVGEASTYDPSLAAEASAAGVTVAPMWGLLSDEALAAGTAAWMQPCETGGTATTLIAPGTPCGQGYTTASPLGTVLSVSRSYQLGYASLPFQSTGRNGGLTFQVQMDTALSVRPDVLLINAWNEHIAQPQANPYDASYGDLKRSMGATDVSDSDPSADWLWVDMYGQEFNRDFEPTVEGGTAGYDLLSSCLRVYRSGATGCDDSSEACCQRGLGWSLVYSLRVRGGGVADTDHLPTLSAAERDSLVAGGGWEEVGNPFYAPPGLASGGTSTDGPFQLYAEAADGRTAVYRCLVGVDHFMSTDPSCEGQTTEGPLGWVANTRSSEMPRPLLRCYNPVSGAHPHSLVEGCPSGTIGESVLGYVR